MKDDAAQQLERKLADKALAKKLRTTRSSLPPACNGTQCGSGSSGSSTPASCSQPSPLRHPASSGSTRRAEAAARSYARNARAAWPRPASAPSKPGSKPKPQSAQPPWDSSFALDGFTRAERKREPRQRSQIAPSRIPQSKHSGNASSKGKRQGNASTRQRDDTLPASKRHLASRGESVVKHESNPADVSSKALEEDAACTGGGREESLSSALDDMVTGRKQNSRRKSDDSVLIGVFESECTYAEDFEDAAPGKKDSVSVNALLSSLECSPML